MSGHALLSASSSNRWIHCPPSIRQGEKYENKGSQYAAVGTETHLLGEFKLKKKLGIEMVDPVPGMQYYDQTMEEVAEEYSQYVSEVYEKIKEVCNDPLMLIEQHVDYGKWVESGYGTTDAAIVADGTAYIFDLKSGSGILVSSENNSQLRCYSLGILEMFDGIYDIQNIAMVIIQPARSNISASMLVKEDLLEWADTVLKPAAELAYKGEGEYSCGDWCQFCPIKHICKARADFAMELAKYEFKDPAILDDKEIEEILGRVDELISWAGDVKEYALQQAISGKEWTGWKLVEGRSTRKYSNEDAVAQAVEEAGYDPYEKKLLGITAMTQKLGKKKFNELLSGLVIKPAGRPTLAPESDKRPAMNTAKQDFMEESK